MPPTASTMIPRQYRTALGRPVLEDLDDDPEGDGTALCITLCWSPSGAGSR